MRFWLIQHIDVSDVYISIIDLVIRKIKKKMYALNFICHFG